MTLQIKPSPLSETKDHRWKLGCQYPRLTITRVPTAPFFFQWRLARVKYGADTA